MEEEFTMRSLGISAIVLLLIVASVAARTNNTTEENAARRGVDIEETSKLMKQNHLTQINPENQEEILIKEEDSEIKF